MGQLFGTDGIRGMANKELDAPLAFKIGQAAACVLSKEKGTQPLFIIGKDTRISSDMLEASLIGGLCSAGANVITLGVVPTPAVAFTAINACADAGIVISASHNPYWDNGIKFFSGNGYKLPDSIELEIENIILTNTSVAPAESERIGRVLSGGEDALQKYIEHIASVSHKNLNLKVAVDCANGAASFTAPAIFDAIGVDCEIICHSPDGININNNCGSTHLDTLKEKVISGGFDIGIAFDGDADRCLALDEKGQLIDGDKIIALCARDMAARGTLRGTTLVATVMSNLGLKAFTSSFGVDVACANVGDRNVLELMQKLNSNIGGEQSGHIIFLDDATTGDGELAAMHFLNVVAESGKKASELAGEIESYPQTLINVRITGGNAAKEAIMASQELKDAVSETEHQLSSSGRVLIRPSGTEPVIRVLVEAQSKVQADTSAEYLANIIKNIVS